MMAIATGKTTSRALSSRKISATKAMTFTASGARGRSVAAPGEAAIG
jgi:hypothetical protein